MRLAPARIGGAGVACCRSLSFASSNRTGAVKFLANVSEERVGFDGCTINWRVKGEGDPVVFFHGAGGLVDWLPFYDLLASTRTLYAPDHPGFGLSDEPDIAEVGDLARFYIGLFRQMGLSRLDIVGSSLGGWLAAEIAIRAPELVRSLVLFSPAGIAHPDHQPGNFFIWDRETLAASLFHDQIHVQHMLDAPASPELIAKLQKNRRTTQKVAGEPLLHGEFLAKSLSKLSQPVQLVWGRNDRIIPVQSSDIWLGDVENAKLTVFEECGHLPFLERCEASYQITQSHFAGA